ncbi:MAG: methyltransferase [Candidatus Nanopelagicaceae bacterium]
MKQSIDHALREAVKRVRSEDFVRCILTGKRRSISPKFSRVDIRPVEIKGKVMLQMVSHDGKRDFTSNLDLDSAELEATLDSGFSNIIVDSINESFQVQITKKEEAIVGTSKTQLERNLNHDHTKYRLLAETEPIFAALGMADSMGRIKPSERDKYIQIDQLLRLLEPIVERVPHGTSLRLIDLACGSAALTFAVHVYLSKRFSVVTVGIERNQNLIDKARLIASDNEIKEVEFRNQSIENVILEKFDVVLALHACDTATDDAISFVIESKSSAALIVPCCHQSRPEELKESIALAPILSKDGILYERFADLLTDGLRAERFRSAGYQVEVVEFVPDEHTARNLMIRATSF